MKKRRILTALMIVTLLCTIMLSVAQAAAPMYIDGQTALKVHLRQEPYTGSESLGLFYTGTPVLPVAIAVDGWFQVQIGDVIGYVSAEYLNTNCLDFTAPEAVVRNANSNWAHLRQGASTQSLSIGRLYNDQIVYVLGELKNGWTYIQSGDQMGFVLSEFIKTNVADSPDSSVMSNTKRLLAEPNLYMVGFTPQGQMIFALTVPTNGQVLYFVSQTKDPAVYWDDVNFDGRDDLVVTTATGTSNQMFAFYIFNGVGYTPVQVPMQEHDLGNYQLIPEHRMVATYMNNGSAGACHEYVLYRWEGVNLKVARRAVADVLVEQYQQDGVRITTTNDRMFEIVVSDYSAGSFEDSTTFRTIVSSEEIEAALEQEQEALWIGLK